MLLEQAGTNPALAARKHKVARVKLALLPDLPLQNTDSTQAQAQSQAATAAQQSQTQNSQPGQAAQPQAQGQQATGIPPQ